jgi:hypothetical protein
MASPPKLKVLSMETFKDVTDEVRPVLETLITQLNPFLTATSNALTQRLTPKDNFLIQQVPSDGTYLVFTTPAASPSPYTLASIKTNLGYPPRTVKIDQFSPVSASLSSAWSWTWDADSSGAVIITFQGLPVSTKFKLRVTFEF